MNTVSLGAHTAVMMGFSEGKQETPRTQPRSQEEGRVPEPLSLWLCHPLLRDVHLS